jgi:hypothetical protein
MSSVSHITHEAVQKIGGIGAVLHGLITSPAYQKEIGRTLLVGPLFSPSEEDEIARDGEVLFSSFSGIQDEAIAEKLLPIQQMYQVGFVYGRRRIRDSANGNEAQPEVLLVDVREVNPARENQFKFELYERFGLQSDRYEHAYDFLQYLRLAEPAYDAISALLGKEPGPHFILSHEYMGMPTALKTILVADPRFRTIFHAHEVATMRPIVEGSLGHDTMFYNVMAEACEQDLGVSEVFGDQSDSYRHALIERSRHCDNIFAVGDYTLKELKFLGPAFRDVPIELVYNGIPAFEVSLEEKWASVERLRQYAEALCGTRPEVIFTHVTRLVISKGLWRDLQVLEHLDEVFEKDGRKGVFYVLSTAGGTRSSEDVLRMEAEYGWPAVHQEGYPDLVGGEVDFWRIADAFNKKARAIRVIFVNQFGWDRESCGIRMPEEMGMMDLRKGSYLEFGQSIYEPFGIAQVEPLSFGALCVVSNVCGCCGYVKRAAHGTDSPNLVVGDYTTLPRKRSLDELKKIDMLEREWVEAVTTKVVAQEILERLPGTRKEMEASLQRGFELAKNMSWDRVCQDLFLPGLKRAEKRKKLG